MQQSQPLCDANPELSIWVRPGYCEYRVENWHLARDGSGRLIKGINWLTWWDAMIVVTLILFWPNIYANSWALAGLILGSILWLYAKCTQVVFESVVVLPPHGIQLETHRGLPSFPLVVSRHFIPMVALQDFVINEGLRRWDVRYYLAAIRKTQTGDLSLQVAYENILPHFPVLHKVYCGVQSALFSTNGEDAHGNTN